jgi:hypothetical protein
MRPLKAFLSIILLTCLFSCDPLVTFKGPQPPDTKNLTKFPRRLQGDYLSLAGNSVLSIKESIIQRTYDYDLKMHVNELDSNQTISGDTLIIDLENGDRKPIIREGDSLIEHVHFVDTIYDIIFLHTLRKFRGHYFLNIQVGNESWEVKKVQLTKGKLTISSITTQEEVQKLKEITEDESDTVVPYTFAPTKKQFRKFVKSEGFSDSEVFVRMKR